MGKLRHVAGTWLSGGTPRQAGSELVLLTTKPGKLQSSALYSFPGGFIVIPHDPPESPVVMNMQRSGAGESVETLLDGKGSLEGPSEWNNTATQDSQRRFSIKSISFVGNRERKVSEHRLGCKMHSIWDYIKTHVYVCLYVCAHVVLVVYEWVYAFTFSCPLCTCVGVCALTGLPTYWEGARINHF